MVVEYVFAREMVVGTSQKGGIMKTSGVSIGTTTPGIHLLQ